MSIFRSTQRHSHYLVDKRRRRYPIKLFLLLGIIILSLLWIFHDNEESTHNEIEIVRKNQFKTYQEIQVSPSKQQLINNKLSNQTSFTQQKKQDKLDKPPIELDLLVPIQ